MSVSAKSIPRSRTVMLTTSSVVSFSLTLLAGAILVIAGFIPMHAVSFGQRLDIGALLLMTPVVALILGIVFEVTRVALQNSDLPDTRSRQTIRWTPGHREG